MRKANRLDGWTRILGILAAVLLASVPAASRLEAQVFLRGDVNSDGRVSISDAHFLLGFLFRGTGPAQCLRAADVDGDGAVNISDAVMVLQHVVGAGPPPCAPFPEPGEDGRTDPPCDEIEIRPPLEDPEARLRVSNAIAGPGGETVLNLFTTTSTGIAGFFAAIRIEGARFGDATQVTDLSETLAGGFAGAEASGGRLRVGFLSSFFAQSPMPVGVDEPVLQIDVCLEGGLEPGDYEIVVEDAELVDFESGQAILPGTDGDVLAVPTALGDTGCVSRPEPEVVERECPDRPDRPEPPDPPDPPDPPEPPALELDFARGDVNLDGRVSMADSMTTRRLLFIGGREPPCLDAADANDDGGIDISDMIFILNHLFAGTKALPAPFFEPGPDPTPDGLGCDSDEIVPPSPERDDIVRLGEVDAIAGQTVRVPVFLSNRAEIEGFQLVIRSEPPVFRPFELDLDVPGGFFRVRDLDETFGVARMVPGESGIAAVGFIPALTGAGNDVPPGEDHLVFAIRGEIALNAAPGTVVELSFADDVARAGEPGDVGEEGVLLRNELVSGGEARLPELVPGRIRIATGSAILRGDTNHDGVVDLADSVALLGHLFSSGAGPTCADEADANDDGRLNITDPIAILITLFEGLPRILPPFPDPGVDPTEDGLPACGGVG